MTKPRLWTRDFTVLSFAYFFLAVNFYLLMVFISGYAMERFHARPSQAGLATSIFVIGSLLARLLSGKWIERIGRGKMLKIGVIASFILCLFYFAANNILSLLLVRFLHGAAFGMTTTAVMTIVAAVIPGERRGEGLGYFMLSVTLGTATGPFLGMLISQHGSFVMVFAACAAAAGLSMIFALFVSVPELSLTKQQLEGLKGFRLTSFLEPKALPIAIVCGVIFFCYSSVLSFLASYVREAGLVEAGNLFFVVFSAAVLLSRPYAGRLFDVRGENSAMYPAILAFVTGLVTLSQAHRGYTILLSGVLVGIGSAAIQSLSQAISVKITEPHRVGLATSTFFISMDAGVGIGPFVLGLFIPLVGYRGIYMGTGIVAFTCLVLYYLLHGRKAAETRMP
jgi:MFS family permease